MCISTASKTITVLISLCMHKLSTHQLHILTTGMLFLTTIKLRQTKYWDVRVKQFGEANVNVRIVTIGMPVIRMP